MRGVDAENVAFLEGFNFALDLFGVMGPSAFGQSARRAILIAEVAHGEATLRPTPEEMLADAEKLPASEETREQMLAFVRNRYRQLRPALNAKDREFAQRWCDATRRLNPKTDPIPTV